MSGRKKESVRITQHVREEEGKCRMKMEDHTSCQGGRRKVQNEDGGGIVIRACYCVVL